MAHPSDAIEDLDMAMTPTEIVRTWFTEVWQKGQADAIDRYASPHWVGHGVELPDQPAQSYRDRFKTLYSAYRTAFPDISITVDKTVAEGDMVAAHCTARGTHTGEGLGSPPTGKSIDFSGIVMARVADGVIVESWESWQFLTMHLQLGRTLV